MRMLMSLSARILGAQQIHALLCRSDPPLVSLMPTPPPPILVFLSVPQKRKTTTISVEVKKSQHKYIIGPKGNTLQEILETTGVSVEMPQLDSGSETIILRGEPDKLGPALTQVYAKVRLALVKAPCDLCPCSSQ